MLLWYGWRVEHYIRLPVLKPESWVMVMIIPHVITEFDTCNEQRQEPGGRCHYVPQEDLALGGEKLGYQDGDAFVESF